MRRRVIVLVCAFSALLASSVVAYAADDNWDNWYWDCRVSIDTVAGDLLHYGVSPGSSDGYDGEHLAHDGESPVHAGVYHDSGWPEGFYAEDFRSPISLASGSSKSWLISVWCDPSLDFGVSSITFATQIGGILPPRDFRYTLTLLEKPAGIEDGPMVGASYDMSYYTFNWGAAFQLPSYRTDDGRNGYVIELKATAIPEPSAFVALACGLVGMTRRRRQ